MLLFSCGDSVKEQNDDLLSDYTYAESLEADLAVPELMIAGLVQSIPSPVEMSSLIKATGVEFNASLLNNPAHIDKYESAHSKAINLGAFGTDLGYLNIYDKALQSVDHLTAVRSLAKDLKIDQFFDFEMMKRLASTNGNVDSLLNITNQSFDRMESFLRGQKRTKASVMIVTGMFIEGLYLSSQIASTTLDPRLMERVGEQKISLEYLSKMLEIYKADPNITVLATQFSELKTLYDQVEIIITESDEPEMIEVDGVLQIIDSTTSEVIMDDDLFHEIVLQVAIIRNSLCMTKASA